MAGSEIFYYCFGRFIKACILPLRLKGAALKGIPIQKPTPKISPLPAKFRKEYLIFRCAKQKFSNFFFHLNKKSYQFNLLGRNPLLLGGNCPLAVPEKIVGLTLFLDFFDRGAKRFSLYLPQAALKSFALYTREPLFLSPMHPAL